MYLRFSSVAHVRAGDDVLRVDHLRGPVLRSLRTGTGQARPLFVSSTSAVLREVEHDAFCGGTSTRCGIDLPVEHGAVCRF